MRNSLVKLLFFCFIGTTSIYSQETIHVYGPGGPHTALIEAAELFKAETGITAHIVYGPQAKWQEEALKNADILFSASDNQMTAFLQSHSKNFSQDGVVPLYLHNSIILVKKGNPRKIKGIRSLVEMKDVRIVVNDGAGVSVTSGTGVWEDILGRLNNINDLAAFRKKIVAYVPNSGMGRDAFNDPKLQADAWITWNDWALSNDFGEAVHIEKNLNISRPLNFALKNNPKQSLVDFTEFLKSPKAQAVFKKYGWYLK